MGWVVKIMPEPSPSDPLPSLRIFVVENHPDTLRYLRMYLEMVGHAVESAGTMEAALAALPGADADVLISDIGLPDGSGWELLRRLHLPRPVYAIAMSGFGTSADQARSQAVGYRHHLLKPFMPEELDGMLEAAAHELHANDPVR